MTETNELPNLPSFPEKKRRTGSWIAGAVVVVAAVVIGIVIANSGPSLTADKSLEPALLTSGEFPGGFDVSVLTQEQLDEVNKQQDLPDDIQPAECAELLRSAPQPTGDYSVGAVQAANTSTKTFYVEMITPVGGVEDWDPARIDEIVAKCATTTFSQDGQTGTVTFAKIAGVGDDGFALRTSVEAGGVTITLGVAVSKIGEHVVVFTGGTGGEFAEAEFVQLATAANDKARAEL